jgi:hypothetical protein
MSKDSSDRGRIGLVTEIRHRQNECTTHWIWNSTACQLSLYYVDLHQSAVLASYPQLYAFCVISGQVLRVLPRECYPLSFGATFYGLNLFPSESLAFTDDLKE